eukprot:TRINITY_DN10460_c1_g3_i2.p2 TRINITY_DN10460_c1_g3~~TRINITY_DN10460_c1_g3_i2.p2  ORF type:complete len:252 (-),score=46.40 TRINITY_DN10460_c1_g3_i2:338-1093(-)
MPLAGISVVSGRRVEKLPCVFPRSVLECSSLVARHLNLWPKPPGAGTASREPSFRWLRLHGEALIGGEALGRSDTALTDGDSLGPGREAWKMQIDSDAALRRYLDLAGRSRIYAEIRATVETVYFEAPAPVPEDAVPSEPSTGKAGDDSSPSTAGDDRSAGGSRSGAGSRNSSRGKTPHKAQGPLRIMLEGVPYDVPQDLGSLSTASSASVLAVGRRRSVVERAVLLDGDAEAARQVLITSPRGQHPKVVS